MKNNRSRKSILDIEKCLNILSDKRPVFVSETDFQVELSWIIKELYPDAKVRCEAVPTFNLDMHIDILVIKDGRWIPIELKYKTKQCKIVVDDEEYNLKNHSAKDVSCYSYLKDIQRIESIRSKVSCFGEGYTILLTNDISYLNAPRKKDCVYRDFSLEEGITKRGRLKWAESTGEGTKKGKEEPIELKDGYVMKWETYSVIDEIDETSTETFWYLINRILKKL